MAVCDEYQLAFAATLIDADLVRTAGFDAPAAYRNIDSFAPAVSGGGGDFATLMYWR